MERDKTQNMYTCPMHPGITRDAPGICPECGMNLMPARNRKKHEHAERGKHAGHSTEMFLRKFWVSAALTVPVVLYADAIKKIFGWSPPDFPGSAYAQFVFGSIVFFYGGRVFLAGAWQELKARLPGMMTLIGLAISAAYLWSVYAVFVGAETLFWEITTLITIMLLGHWLEMRAVSGAQGALKELSKLLPDTAEVISGNSDFPKLETKTVPLSELRENDIVLVRPGAKIPADGAIIDGESDVNESMVTGESRPVSKKEGSTVIAGTINGGGALKVKVTNIGENTFLAGIMRLVAEAQASKSRLQILSDRAAFYLTVVAVAGGGITLAAWLAAGAETSFAVARLVAVLVIACPHALGLAVPLVASISTIKAAQNGFLVRSRLALEAARNIDVVLFDKTGTLTKGEYGVTEIIQNPKIKDQDENEILRFAASVDSRSEHPAAQAIVRAARERRIAIPEVKDFSRLAGRGARGAVGGKEFFVGGEAIMRDASAVVPEEMTSALRDLSSEGKTLVYVAAEGSVRGAIALGDAIRGESREAIRSLNAMGVKVAMITGDSEGVAEWVAGELEIDEYFARVLPHQKSEKVKGLQTRGLKVAMVGDGINDAPALTQADLGIAIGAGTNVAIESAGIILVRNDPRDIVKIITLSRLTYAKMVQNLFWATGYNVVALPLAAGVLAPQGILLEPALAALFMSLSTVIVAINAVLLKKQKL